MANLKFFEWQTPEDLKRLAELESEGLGALALKGPGQEFREAFAASRFALHCGATAVRLLETRQGQQTPDFALISMGKELWFETTEIDRPGRRRGDEPLVEGAQSFADHEWSNPEELFEAAVHRITSKVKKTYDKCDGLLIWFNAFPVERAHQINQQWWESAASTARTHFTEVWVHQAGKFTKLSD
ncbi:hypothetical protein ACFFF7_15055 [Novosphingobium aquiterrae]|uniref:Uncharacterized protein n=1 Tax=Novosphingobium aquiterrae TaxID=624388 RepID=A0ABV6PMT7_9SPHN